MIGQKSRLKLKNEKSSRTKHSYSKDEVDKEEKEQFADLLITDD